MLQRANNLWSPGAAVAAPEREFVAELRARVRVLEEDNRALRRQLIDSQRIAVRVTELEEKIDLLEGQLVDKDGEMEVEIQNVIEEIETERTDEVRMIDRVVYEVSLLDDPSELAENLYHEVATANGTNTSWATAQPSERAAFIAACDRLFRETRRALHDYRMGILRTPDQVGS